MAETARKLDMTRGGMHGIIHGDTIPSVATVKLFRLVLKGEIPGIVLPPHAEEGGGDFPLKPSDLREPEAQYTTRGWQTEVIDNLNALHPEEREKVIDVLNAALRLTKRPVRTTQNKAA